MLIDIDNFFNNDVIISSLLKKLSVSIKIHVVCQTAMESVWPVSKLSIESVGSRRELVANSCTHRRRQRDATKQFRRVGVGGVYWALCDVQCALISLFMSTHCRVKRRCSKLLHNAVIISLQKTF